MPEDGRCAECGSPIPPDAPGGACPKCLLKQGLPEQAPTRTAVPGRHSRPPSTEDLARHFPDLEILELIGQGGMGAVYRARQKKLDRLVALKILAIDAARGPTFAERFTREARTLAKVSHPNIVAIHDFGETEGLFYFVMEYVDGANLRDVLRAGTLSPGEALAVVPQICDALQFAHGEGVVHRDIKPENILLDRKGRVKIADFGLAKLLQREQVDYTLTAPGDVMGTPAYMAPEQIERPTEVDHRADIYSVGVVFYEMLTGELPLGRFQPPSSKVQVDVRLDDVVLRTLEKEPERRYQHADDLKTDVESIGTEKPAPGASPASGVALHPQPGGPVAAAPPAPHASTPGEGVGDTRATGSPPVRTLEVRRPAGVTWVVVYSIYMALAYAAFAGIVSRLGGTLVPGRVQLLLGPWSPGLWPSGFFPFGAGTALLPHMLCWAFIAAHVLAAIGLLRLHGWARTVTILLAVCGVFMFPVGTVFSIFVLAYLLRRDVARLFELGEGPATLPLQEARRLERTMGRAAGA